MSSWVGNVIVIVVVLASAGYALWSLGPNTWRECLRVRLVRHFPALRRLLAPSMGGCPSCSACKTMIQRRP